ncbi:protein MODIFIER OF SNC1 1, partial [Sesamum indicum]|uniref:Protein MODIFIER OF SNC1 1 n=1 Tax=Sesamum indicum TaxID=4182 RepID=A0A6I9URC1_SESIN
MNSSMLAGERRWASARRGGMTVLGKVAVPKPLNLPSQRLENHGLDPNVEIVPKGTHSWGSRSSSSSSNPWISSSLSPNAEGGNVSPTHLSGRPSSGGSGTRPSTAGSDRTYEPAASAWGSNSRPSSASGSLSSNQTPSASLRPRSAENRPTSSQLSRFAEPVPKSSVAWGPSNTAERLGVKSSKEDGFSLSSGDFPTLGSEKDNSVKNIESEDHGRPSSASGRFAQSKEDTKSQADVKRGTVNTWRADGSRSAEDDMHPSMEKWQGDPHQYFNSNTAPQHFDAWRGPPMNGPAGVWYGGRPRGPAFGAPVAPGGFPMEPFPYYHPQIPHPPLAGSQPVPPPGGGPRGPHPKNGDLYRPQMPDAYARPSMPFRPGFYPGPPGPMAFEGYYGPPMGYCNSEREIPYMGMPGPHVYNGYPAPAPDIGNSHGRAAGRGPSGKGLPEQVEADYLEDAKGPKRVPLKNHNERDQREEGDNREHNMQSSVAYPGKSRLPMMPSRKNEWGAEEDTEEATFAKRIAPNENSSRSCEYRVHSADGMKVKSYEGVGNLKAVNNNWTNKSESMSSFPPEMPQLLRTSERDSSIPATTKNSALMHKIDGLNAKIRASDGRNDAPNTSLREEERDGSQMVDRKINNYNGDDGDTAGSFESTPISANHVSVQREVIVPVGDKPMQPTTIASRRSYYGGQGRVDHLSKGKFNSQDADGWRRKPLTVECSSGAAVSDVSAPNDPAHGPNIVVDASENPMVNPTGKIEGDSVETSDSTDIQAQRAKMRELAKQRALQLQKEEEERTREQKAKALAKLEELNRRTIAGEAANGKAERTQSIADNREQEETHTLGELVTVAPKFQQPGHDLITIPNVIVVDRDSNVNQAGESVEVCRNLPGGKQQMGSLESNLSSLPVHEDAHNGSAKKVASQLNDGGISRHKRAGYKQKQNSSLPKSLNEKSASNVTSEVQKDDTHAATVDVTLSEGPSSEIKLSESNLPNCSTTVVEPSVLQKKKSNKSSKNKPKMDETPAVPVLQPVMPNINPGKESVDSSESKNSVSNSDSSVSAVIEPDRGVQAQEVCSPNEESQSRVSNQWKPPSRRMPRSQQANRFVEKPHGSDAVVWAPVRTQNKAKGSVEASQKSIQESANPAKGDNLAQNSSKGKRAEMERYVPKPVAKELAQQGNVPPVSSSITVSRSTEGPGREQYGSDTSAGPLPVNSATGHLGSSVEIEGDGSHNKHKKDHGMWRQRGSTDASHTKGAHLGPSPVSEPSKDVQQSKEHVQLVKSEKELGNAETKNSSIANTSDGYNMSNNTTTATVSKYPSVKDQGATGRGKRHLPRAPRSTGNNPDPESTFSGEIEGSHMHSAASDFNQTDRPLVSKENRSIGERTSSHWQPKSHSTSANNQHGNRTPGSEFVTTETNRLTKKDHPQHKVQVSAQHDKDSGIISHNVSTQSAKSNLAEDSVGGHQQEFDREKKPAPARGRPYSPNQDPLGSGESPPTANRDDQLERSIPSGYRRNGRQNNRSFRGHESRGDWSSGHDNRPHNVPPFRDNRPRQNLHYEYHPVGAFKGNKSEKAEEPTDGGDSMEQRHRE